MSKTFKIWLNNELELWKKSSAYKHYKEKELITILTNYYYEIKGVE